MSVYAEKRIPERVIEGNCHPLPEAVPGVILRGFASTDCGAKGFSTGSAEFASGAVLAYHWHPCSEAITVVEGTATVLVEGRSYRLSPLDSVHVPAGVAHSVQNREKDQKMLAHCAFGSANPARNFGEQNFPDDPRGAGLPRDGEPEYVSRAADRETYELSPGALFSDLFAGRFGSKGICGGYGRFDPGASLPCHVHEYDESITIMEGEALCLVSGRKYTLSGLDTAFVPEGLPHRFLNNSGGPMAMIWVYAGDEPGRTLIDAGYCSGTLVWPPEISEATRLK